MEIHFCKFVNVFATATILIEFGILKMSVSIKVNSLKQLIYVLAKEIMQKLLVMFLIPMLSSTSLFCSKLIHV